MDYYFQCKLCGEKFNVRPYCPCVFGDHLLEKHPELQFTFFTCERKNKAKLHRNNCDCCVCCERKKKKSKGVIGMMNSSYFIYKPINNFNYFFTNTVSTVFGLSDTKFLLSIFICI